MIHAVPLYFNKLPVVKAAIVSVVPLILSTLVVLDVPDTSPANVDAVPNLLLNVTKSVEVRYPFTVVEACVIEITGVDVPVATEMGAVPVTFVTDPVAADTQDKTPAPFVFKT